MDKKNTTLIEVEKLITILEHFEKLNEKIDEQKKYILTSINICKDALMIKKEEN